jgi:hypothetical protein
MTKATVFATLCAERVCTAPPDTARGNFPNAISSSRNSRRAALTQAAARRRGRSPFALYWSP